MIFGPGGRDHDSQNQLCSTLETPQYFKQLKKNPNRFRKITCLEISEFWTSRNLKVGKRRGPANPEELSTKQHEMKFLNL